MVVLRFHEHNGKLFKKKAAQHEQSQELKTAVQGSRFGADSLLIDIAAAVYVSVFAGIVNETVSELVRAVVSPACVSVAVVAVLIAVSPVGGDIHHIAVLLRYLRFGIMRLPFVVCQAVHHLFIVDKILYSINERFR